MVVDVSCDIPFKQKLKFTANIESLIADLRFGFIYVGLILIPAISWSQETTSLWKPDRQQLALPPVDSIFLDTAFVLETTLQIRDNRNNLLEAPNYELKEGQQGFYILFKETRQDTLQINYRVASLNLSQYFRHKDTMLILPATQKPAFLYEYENPSSSFAPFRGLNSKGSISRSISVGNNQDAVLNSSLNLQLAGNLGNQTEIRASITDNSIPVQADGFTQQLREFDRVYIELENPDFGLLRAGDYNITSAQNYFLQFDKRVSGAGIFTSPGNENAHWPIQVQGGIARGRFARNRFQGTEGNQGPYKLTGANGEQFIIIISGSERVYIDGVLMKRGEQYDYVIDYNAGEITFTALQPITKERRVVIEFQYTEQNYLRSVVFGSGGYQSEKLKTSVQFYSEQDSRNQPLTDEITDPEKEILSNIGDRLDEALISTINLSDYSPDLILYRLTDTLGFDSVLVYTTDSTGLLYQASFAFLGTNQGNYILTQSNANGRVFEWVPPLNGIPQGSYEPVKQLVAPNQLQILTVETEAQLNDNHKLQVDLAGSRNDLNLFSSLDENNDVGTAGRIQYEGKKEIGESELFGSARYEFNQDNFTTIERIRRVEFARDWNLPLNFNGGLQLAGASVGIKKQQNQLAYITEFMGLSGYEGFKNSLAGKLKTKKTKGFLTASWLTTTDSVTSSDFLREQGEFIYFLTSNYWAGLRSVGEWNLRSNIGTDSLNINSYSFFEYQVFTGIGDTSASFVELSYLRRFDDTARSGELLRFSEVNTYGLRSNLKTNFNSILRAYINFRNLKVLQPEEREIERTITSRLNYTQRLFQNSIISTTFYETGSGTEPLRSFSYIEVPAGTGTYAHIDYNNNGIRELNEFEIAPNPDQARFIRIFTPNNQFVRTNLNKFGQNLNINSPGSWSGKEDYRKTLARFALLLSYQLDRKTLLSGNANTLNPFATVEDDSLIVSLNNSFRSTVFFNRTATKFGMDYTYLNSDNRSLLSFGVEQRAQTENTLNVRYQLSDPFLFRVSGTHRNSSNNSANFSSRNFSIEELRNNYSLAYQPSERLILTAMYNWSNQQSFAENPNFLVSQTAGLEFSYNLAESISLQTECNYIFNGFEGSVSNPAAFEMLQGLEPGDNATWALNLQKTFRKNILLTLIYNGRMSRGNQAIHTGNLQIKAFF